MGMCIIFIDNVFLYKTSICYTLRTLHTAPPASLSYAGGVAIGALNAINSQQS